MKLKTCNWCYLQIHELNKGQHRRCKAKKKAVRVNKMRMARCSRKISPESKYRGLNISSGNRDNLIYSYSQLRRN